MTATITRNIRLAVQDGQVVLQEIERVGRGSEAALGGIGRGADHASQRLRAMEQGITGRLGGIAQQIQDVAVQWQSGTSAAIVFAQQGPQILSAFGPVGAILGGVAAAATVLGSAIFGVNKEAEKAPNLLEGFARALRTNAGEANTLAEAMKSAGEETRKLLQEMARLEAQKRATEASGKVDSITGALNARLLNEAVQALPPVRPPGPGELSTRGDIERQQAKATALGSVTERMRNLRQQLVTAATSGDQETLSRLIRENGLLNDDSAEAITRLQEIAAAANTIKAAAEANVPALERIGQSGRTRSGGRTAAETIADLKADLLKLKDPVSGALAELRASESYQKATAAERAEMERLTEALVRGRGELKEYRKEQAEAAAAAKRNAEAVERAALAFSKKVDPRAAAAEAALAGTDNPTALQRAQIISYSNATYDQAQYLKEITAAEKEAAAARREAAGVMSGYLTEYEKATLAIQRYQAALDRAGPMDADERALAQRALGRLRLNQAVAGGDVWAGVQSGMQQFVQENENLARVMERGVGGAVETLSAQFATFFATGKLGAREMAAELAAMASRMLLNYALAQALGFALNAAGSTGGSSGPIAGPNGMAAQVHGGGTIGEVPLSRSVPMALFAGARRYHGGGWPGLAPDEVPAILQKGERVLSRAEVAQGAGRGGGLTIQVDARGASDPMAIEQAVHRAVSMALAAVPEEAQRNPAYRAALVG